METARSALSVAMVSDPVAVNGLVIIRHAEHDITS